MYRHAITGFTYSLRQPLKCSNTHMNFEPYVLYNFKIPLDIVTINV